MVQQRVVIFGGGRVGQAMAAEMPRALLIRRGQDAECDVACVCWPAQAIRDFAAAHPRGAAARHVVAFCNGAWAVADGAGHAGICYVRASHAGDRAAPGRKAWTVGEPAVAAALRAAGLGVTCSYSKVGHEAKVWGKALYLLPLCLACADLEGTGVRLVTASPVYAEWYDVVRCAAVDAIGEQLVAGQEARVRYLVERTPRGWFPSPSREEIEYFRRRLGCAST